MDGIRYTCPLHPDAREPEPGRCPACGVVSDADVATSTTHVNHPVVEEGAIARLANSARGAIPRRTFVCSTAAAALWISLDGMLPAYGRQFVQGTRPNPARVPGEPIDLSIQSTPLEVGGRTGSAITVNGVVPGPLVRLREGEEATIRVHNRLDEDTSVHWHGLILPFDMDGVPGVSYAGIRPGETFTYRFPVRQHGTYWYHSHTGLQEQLGHYGPLVIDPADDSAREYDREHIVILSDWTFENPYKVLARLKKMAGYYNFQRRTAREFLRDASRDGLAPTTKDRLAWARMRMDPTDMADITGHTYTYLVNGLAPGTNWTGLFTPGERVRLRLINAATMTYFNVRIPGLPMTVVQADGQNVQPVETDEIQMAVAETYDVIVRPTEDRAYTIFAESMDRSGYGRGTLAPRPGMSAPVPELRERPVRTMSDMGMDMGSMNGMGTMQMDEGGGAPATDPPAMPGMDHTPTGHDAGATSQSTRTMPNMPGMDRSEDGSPESGALTKHGPDHHGRGNSSVAAVQRNRLAEPGTGLADAGHRVLVYADLRRAANDFEDRAATRELELHLTANMERYMWSFDGKKYSEVDGPIRFSHGERLRLILANDTMMEHPIHLHGMWMELENGQGRHIPRKHTISVKPAERLSVLITADAPGRWAFHCHLLYHMEMGMFRVVEVS